MTNEPTLRALEAGHLPGSPLHYQPSERQGRGARGDAAVAPGDAAAERPALARAQSYARE